jgi:capsular polysaccharide transport system permease protein
VQQLAHAAAAISRELWRRRVVRWVTVLLPSILAALYYFGIASDQYESEARFVVRSAARPAMPGGLSFLVQLGFTRSQDDSFIVQDFMTSRDAIEKLKVRLQLVHMFSGHNADFLARYPSIIYGPEAEEFYRYFESMVTVLHLDKSGISTLRVRAFKPEDARDIAATLLLLAEELVNRINTRIQQDAIANSLEELTNAQQRLVAAQASLTEFRNRELTVDPARNAVSLAELIAQLSAELATTQAQVAEMKSSTAGSPQLVGLQRKAAALERQIAEERKRIAGNRDGLATRIAAYERLQLEREFARRLLTNSEVELTRSRNEAARQLLYLERIVEPHLADYSTQPKRTRTVLTIFLANVLLASVAWLIVSGVQEHAASRR